MISNDAERVILYVFVGATLLICSAFPLHEINAILDRDAHLGGARLYEKGAEESAWPGETHDASKPELVSNDVVLYGNADIACHDIIPKMESRPLQYSDYYAYDIAEVIYATRKVDYDIFAMGYDMDDDAKQDVITYFMSPIHVGRLGNIAPDIWTEDNFKASGIPFRDRILLNPPVAGLKYVRIDILNAKTNGFHDFGVTQLVSGKEFQSIYAFDGEMYSKVKWQKVTENEFW
jgi:hypothetical protein